MALANGKQVSLFDPFAAQEQRDKTIQEIILKLGNREQ